MDVEILIHVYADSGHLSLKTTPTQSMEKLSNNVKVLLSLVH